MYLILLAFGAVLTVAGILLGAAGISIHDRAFDASLVTPGVVAAAGGLILIGLGFALRVLQRIELALAARPMPRAARTGETAVAAEAGEPMRIPFPPKPEPGPQAVPVAVSAAPVEPVSPHQPRLQLASLARLGSALAGQESEVSTLAKATGRVDEAVGELNNGRAARLKNGTRSGKIAPRLDAPPRPSAPPERPKGPAFDTLWPKGPRPSRAMQSPPVPAATLSAAEPEQSNEPVPDAPAMSEPEAEQLSILKSGVVDGMAYPLYSDGSIEAELPQGTIRFGSITELRNHIEQSPPDAISS